MSSVPTKCLLLTTGHLVLVYVRSKQIKGSNELYLSGQNTTLQIFADGIKLKNDA